MVWIRMLWVACRVAWPHLLIPWRSPLVRWRMETYGVIGERGVPMSAQEMSASTFFRFLTNHHRELRRFLRWAAVL